MKEGQPQPQPQPSEQWIKSSILYTALLSATTHYANIATSQCAMLIIRIFCRIYETLIKSFITVEN